MIFSLQPSEKKAHDRLFEELVHAEIANRTMTERGGLDFPDFDAITGHDELLKNYLHTFIAIHRTLTQDSSQYHKIKNSTYYRFEDLPAAKKETLKKAFGDFISTVYNPTSGALDAKEPDTTEPQQLNILRIKAFAGAAGTLYRDLSRIHLHGAQQTLGIMLREIGKSHKFREHISPEGIDFTRTREKLDARASNIAKRVEEAILNPAPPIPKSSPYIPEPGHFERIEGMPFMAFRPEGDFRTYLVMRDGALVDYTTEGDDSIRAQITRHIASGAPLTELRLKDVSWANPPHLADYIIMDKDHIRQTLKRNAVAGSNGADDDEIEKRAGKILRRNKKLFKKLNALRDAKEMEGFTPQQAHITPFALNIDLMTGLVISSDPNCELAQFKKLLKDQQIDLMACFRLPATPSAYLPPFSREEVIHENLDRIVERLKEATQDTPQLHQLVLRAAPQLHRMLPDVLRASDKNFFYENKEGEKKPIKPIPDGERTPYTFSSQGGHASGKSRLEKIALNISSKKHLVFASLDDVRGESASYYLYPGSGCFNFRDPTDYATHEWFGNLSRTLTVERALAGKYDLYYDGSGIPYRGEGRVGDIMAKHKEMGRETWVLGAYAPLYTAPQSEEEAKTLREKGFVLDNSMKRNGHRMEEELRIVPVELLVRRHLGHPLAAANTVQDKNVDHYMLMDNTGPKEESYLLSYTVTVNERELKRLTNGKAGPLYGARLHQELEAMGKVLAQTPKVEKSSQKKQKESGAEATPATPAPLFPWPSKASPDGHFPMATFKVVKDLGAVEGEHRYRLEVITDIEQYGRMQEKGRYYKHANGPDELAYYTLAWDITGQYANPFVHGTITIGTAKNVRASPWEHFTPPSPQNAGIVIG